jgi:putative membrane protein
MNFVAQAAAVLAGLLHVVIFTMESVLFGRPQIHRRFLTAPQDVDAVRPWALNQGFYNLFLGLGVLAGVVWLHTGDVTVGRTLVVFGCLCMLGAALVLVLTDRRMARAAVTQGLLPLIAVVAALL